MNRDFRSFCAVWACLKAAEGRLARVKKAGFGRFLLRRGPILTQVLRAPTGGRGLEGFEEVANGR